MVIICGISAWQLHATAPAIRDLSNWEEGPARLVRREATRLRSNANEGIDAVAMRLDTDLKGVSTPVHLMGDHLGSSRKSALVVPHRRFEDLRPGDVMPLGNDLYVLSIERTLLDLARSESFAQTVLRCLEACGIYAVSAETDRSRATVADYLQAYAAALSKPGPITAYSGDDGRSLPLGDAWSDAAAWSPCIDRRGSFDGMWKRPPLTSCEKLALYCTQKSGVPGIKMLSRAVQSVQDGSGSPLESQFYLFYALSARLGGEGWPRPSLNQRITFSDPARRVAGQRSCVADILFPGQRGVIEVLGKRFHADEMGFEERNGRTAGLEAMGYRVVEVTHQHMARLEGLDLRLTSIARQLGLPQAKRTAAFIKRRHELFLEVFPHGLT